MASRGYQAWRGGTVDCSDPLLPVGGATISLSLLERTLVVSQVCFAASNAGTLCVL